MSPDTPTDLTTGMSSGGFSAASSVSVGLFSFGNFLCSSSLARGVLDAVTGFASSPFLLFLVFELTRSELDTVRGFVFFCVLELTRGELDAVHGFAPCLAFRKSCFQNFAGILSF